MVMDLIGPSVQRPIVDPAKMPVLTVLVHPEPTDADPGRAQQMDDPDATRLVKYAVADPGLWPWFRLSGLPSEVPPQWSDLSAWRVQPAGDAALALGHAVVLTGHEVSR